ncbi:TPA: hypothetical protein JD850_RS22080 [Citrobacter freundii]|nr:hypothetical protein [Citrobacter freundii]
MKLKHKLAVCRLVVTVTLRTADFWLFLSEKAMNKHDALEKQAREGKKTTHSWMA